jgi:hypothetical protein
VAIPYLIVRLPWAVVMAVGVILLVTKTAVQVDQVVVLVVIIL